MPNQDYYIFSKESSGFALKTPDLGFGGHIIEGFPSEQSAQNWLQSRRDALQWLAQQGLALATLTSKEAL